ncbi:hypothetical protein ACIQJX_05210 [Streptomyces griseoviridis]|uniref:hypothetical protein n=1 Tax=Streptomyces sp. MAA16 TaxID=3035116 RepID=UPI0024752BB8|nr:hypothetical protein [Streptomyces sp. MAA16]MDH6698268.1 hypothetical protein [Streptomyces sp. MAA16]
MSTHVAPEPDGPHPRAPPLPTVLDALTDGARDRHDPTPRRRTPNHPTAPPPAPTPRPPR